MQHKLIPIIAGGALAVGLAFSAPASAGTAWSVSIAGPGYAVAAGRPVYAGPRYYGHRHWHARYAPVVYSAPVVVAPPVVYRAPVVYRPAVVYSAPQVIYSAPVVMRPW